MNGSWIVGGGCFLNYNTDLGRMILLKYFRFSLFLSCCLTDEVRSFNRNTDCWISAISASKTYTRANRDESMVFILGR